MGIVVYLRFRLDLLDGNCEANIDLFDFSFQRTRLHAISNVFHLLSLSSPSLKMEELILAHHQFLQHLCATAGIWQGNQLLLNHFFFFLTASFFQYYQIYPAAFPSPCMPSSMSFHWSTIDNIIINILFLYSMISIQRCTPMIHWQYVE